MARTRKAQTHGSKQKRKDAPECNEGEDMAMVGTRKALRSGGGKEEGKAGRRWYQRASFMEGRSCSVERKSVRGWSCFRGEEKQTKKKTL